MMRCPGCMRSKVNSPLCEHCGYNDRIDNLPHQLPIGTVLRDRYEVGKALRDTDTFLSYHAWDRGRQRAVVIQEFFHAGLQSRAGGSLLVQSSGPEAEETIRACREDFLREGRFQRQLNPIPQLPYVAHLFLENNTAYIVTDLIRGVDLGQYIRSRGGRLSLEETIRLMDPLLEAVQRLHQGGFVHLEIGPDNILITQEGSPRLVGFRSARALGAGVPARGTVLKPGYSPVEQYQTNGVAGTWTDVYALGATIFACLTGARPTDIADRIQTGARLPWEAIPGLSEQQIRALKNATELRPSDRTRSVDVLRRGLSGQEEPAPDVGHLVDEDRTYEPITEPSMEPWSEMTQWGRKKRFAVFAAAAAISVALVTGAAFLAQKAGLLEPRPNEKITAEDLTQVFSGVPDQTIPLSDGSQVEIFLEDDRERGRILRDKNDFVLYKFTGEYDEEGNLLYQNAYDQTGRLLCARTYRYNKNGDLTASATLLDGGLVYETGVYLYDRKGQLKASRVRDGEGQLREEGQAAYSQDGSRISYRRETADGAVTEERYDTSGALLSRKRWDARGKLDFWQEFAWSEGRKTAMTEYDGMGRVTFRTEYTYDASGKLTEETVYELGEFLYSEAETRYAGEEPCMRSLRCGSEILVEEYTMRDIRGETLRILSEGSTDICEYFDVFGRRTETVVWDNEGQILSRSLFDYGEEGSCTGSTVQEFTTNGGSTIHSHDGSGKLLSSNTFDPAGVQTERSETQYDEGGILCRHSFYNMEGTLLRDIEYTVDADGQCTGSTHTQYHGDGGRHVILRDPEGNPLTDTEYDASGQVTQLYRYTYRFNDRGDPVEMAIYNEHDEMRWWCEYTYDDYGVRIDSRVHFV